MELNRISSHLVALATGGMEMGATTVMTVGFRERERILARHRADHRPADEQRLHPSGRRRPGHPRAAPSTGSATWCPPCARASASSSCCCCENPILKGRTVDVGYLDLTGCIALGITGPMLRSTGLPHDLRKLAPYCGYETYDFDVITRDSCDAYGRLCVRLDEMHESLQDRRAGGRPAAGHLAGPVMVEDKKIAWPAQLAIGGDGMGNSLDHIRKIMGTSMESLIHHFKLVTEGFRVPAGQVYAAVESAKGELGVPPRLRRWHPAVPRALPRPVVQQPAGRGGDVRGRPDRRRDRRRRLDRPRDGRRGPLTLRHPRSTQRLRRRRRSRSIARYPQARSALLPLLHLVQSEEGFVSPNGIEFCADVLDLTTAEVSGVATFYTQYKRHPNGEYTVGVCTNTLCAVMGGDEIFDELSEHLGVGHDETTDGRRDHPRAGRVQRGLRLRAGGDGQLGVLRQPDARQRRAGWSTTAGRQRPSSPPGAPARCARSSRCPGCSPVSATAGPTRASARPARPSRDSRSPTRTAGRSTACTTTRARAAAAQAAKGSGGGAPVEQIAEDHVNNPGAPSAHDAGSAGQAGRAPRKRSNSPKRKDA